MRLNLLTASLLTAATAVASATAETPDTLVSVCNVKNVTVVRSANSSVITIAGSDDDENYFYSYTTEVTDSAQAEQTLTEETEWGLSLPFLKERKHKKFQAIYGARVFIGISHPIEEPAGIDPSIECGIGEIAGISYSPWRKGPKFSVGAGFFYQQYSLHGNMVYGKDNKSLLLVAPPEGATGTSSRLRNFGLMVPFTITQEFGHGFGMAVGCEVRFNTFTKASSKYSIGNTDYSMSFKGLHQRLMTIDLYGAIGWTEEIGLYVRYSPLGIFRDHYGPHFDAVSFGIVFDF